MNRRKNTVSAVYSALYFMGLALLLGLGGWQLQRGMAKRVLDDSMQVSSVPTAVSRKGQLDTVPAYGSVRISGQFENGPVFALDNRIYRGEAGYEILTPFRLEDGQALLLINHGWVSKAGVNEALKKLPGSASTMVQGVLYAPEKGFTLGSAYTDTAATPVIIQYIDFPAMSELASMPLSGSVLVVDPVQAPWMKIWSPWVMSPDRHYGYALQWWGLALVFIVFGIIWRRMAKGT